MIRLANGVLHGLHLLLIVFCLTAWAFPQTRVVHLVACGLILVSWFVIGPIIGRPGYCLLTGLQHWMWGRQGRSERPNYLAYLYQQLTGRAPGDRGVRAIECLAQVALYSCTLLSIYLA